MDLDTILMLLGGVAAFLFPHLRAAGVFDRLPPRVLMVIDRLVGNWGRAANRHFTYRAKGLALLVLCGALMAPAPAIAADCNFEKGFDAKVIRFAWPPSMGWNLGFVDFEVGANFGLPSLVTLCSNQSVEGLGAICLIPRIGPVIPLCPKEPEN